MGKDIRIDWDPVKFINGYLKQKIGFKYFSFLHITSCLCDSGGGDPLPGAEPGAGEGEGGAPNHDVGHPVEYGADVTAGREQAVVRVGEVQCDAPQYRRLAY